MKKTINYLIHFALRHFQHFVGSKNIIATFLVRKY